jgi:hypothetical protein
MAGIRLMARGHKAKGVWAKKRQSPLRRLLQIRQIYVRSNGDVQFITVSPISQVCLLIIGLIGLSWMAYASINIVFKEQLLDLKQQKLLRRGWIMKIACPSFGPPWKWSMTDCCWIRKVI